MDAEHLIQEQVRLARLEAPPWTFAAGARVGACFVCFAEEPADRGGGAEPAWAVAVTFEDGRRAAAAVVEGRAAGPYEPGLLALRAGRLLERAVARLPQPPDVLLVNATGRDHPRWAGLALHLGVVLGVPTVGVTDRPLSSEAEEVLDDAGSAARVRRDGRAVACLVRPRSGARGVWAHAAWRTDVATAAEVVRTVMGGARTPLPLREARRLARSARAAARGAAPYPPDAPRPVQVG
jgi:deoxyribonuclease V